MAKKEFVYQGKKIEDLQAMSLEELAPMFSASVRRKLSRGFTEAEQIFLKDVQSSERGIKTHCRDMIILPSMVGKTIGIHTGKVFQDVIIQPQMIGHRLGEFAFTRTKMRHGAVGVASAIKH
jgi:small subunit ribosomal protein S19